MIVDVCRGVAGLCLRGVFLALTLAFLVVLAVAARLAYGPIALTAFAPEIERQANEALAAQAGGPIAQVSIDDAEVRLDSETRRIRLTLLGVVFTGDDGEIAAAVNEASVKFDLAALLTGSVSVRAAEVVGADALLLREADGRFRFGVFGAPTAEAEPAPRAALLTDGPDAYAGLDEETVFATAARVADGLTGARGAPAAFSAFEQLVVRDLDLVYRDEMGDVVYRAPGAAIDFRREPSGAWARAAMAVDVGDPAGPVRVTFEGRRRPDASVVELSARVEDAPAAAIVAQAPALDAMSALDARLSGSLRARLDLTEGDLAGLSAELSAENARIRLTPETAIDVEAVSARFAYDPAADRVDFEEIAYRARGVEGSLSGAVSLLRDSVGRTVAARGGLALGPTRVDRADLFTGPVELTSGAAELAVDAAPGRFRAALPTFSISGPVVNAEGSVDLAFGDDGTPEIDLSVRIPEAPGERLADHWPLGVAPGARTWIAQNLLAGTVRDVALDWRGRPGGAADEQSLTLDFAFFGGAITYLGDLPPVTGIDGRGALTLAGLDIVADRAEVSVETARGEQIVRLDGTTFEIPSFGPGIPPSVTTIQAQGPVDAVTTALDQPPLALIGKLNVAPDVFQGDAVATARLAFPLAKALRLVDIEIAVDGVVTDLAVADGALGPGLTAPRAEIAVTERGLRLSAPRAQMVGRRLAVVAEETFAPAAGAPRRAVRFRTTATARSFEEIGAPPGVLTGSAELSGSLVTVDGRAPRLTIDGDLAALGMRVASLGWTKPAGEPGALSLSGTLSDGQFAPERFEIAAGALSIVGVGRVGDDGRVARVEIERLRLADRVDLAAVLERARLGEGAASAGWRITGGGPLLDLRAWEASEAERASAAASEPGPPLAVDLRFDRLFLMGDAPIDLARIDGARDGQGGWTLALAGSAGAAPVTANLGFQPGGTASIRAATQNAGGLLRALGLLDDSQGGSLRLTANGPADGPYDGRLEIEGLVLEDVPVALDAINVGLLVGILDKAASGGVTLNRVTAPFRLDRRALVIDDAVAVGPTLGATLSGSVVRETGALDLRGSMSPAYAINGALGELPIVGRLLTGGRGEGLIGVAFSVRGTTENPDVSVNPLSALAPGVFRGLFQGGGGGGVGNESSGGDPDELRRRVLQGARFDTARSREINRRAARRDDNDLPGAARRAREAIDSVAPPLGSRWLAEEAERRARQGLD